MGELTEEAKAEIREAIRIVRRDKTGHVNEETIRRVFKEEMAAYKPPVDPPKPPDVPPTDPPKPPADPPVPPVPPAPPTPPTDPPPKKRSAYWGDLD